MAADELGSQKAEQVALLDVSVERVLGRHDPRQVDQVVPAIESCTNTGVRPVGHAPLPVGIESSRTPYRGGPPYRPRYTTLWRPCRTRACSDSIALRLAAVRPDVMRITFTSNHTGGGTQGSRAALLTWSRPSRWLSEFLTVCPPSPVPETSVWSLMGASATASKR